MIATVCRAQVRVCTQVRARASDGVRIRVRVRVKVRVRVRIRVRVRPCVIAIVLHRWGCCRIYH